MLLLALLFAFPVCFGQEERARSAWDLDNFLFDTRYRTQAAVRAFAEANADDKELQAAARRARNIQLMDHDGESTALKLGMSAERAKEFQRHWNRFFWASKNIQYDRVIPEVARRVARDAREGREQYYVTGRTKKLQTATLKQLKAAGLPDADLKHLYMKKNVGVRTLPWKLETVKEIRAASYGTESARDIDAMMQQGQRGVYSDFVLKPHGADGPQSSSNFETINPRSTYARRVNPRAPSNPKKPSKRRT